MGADMAKMTSKEIVAKVKRQQEQESKANVTFRLTKSLTDAFRAKCEKQGVAMTAVLEELISEFLK